MTTRQPPETFNLACLFESVADAVPDREALVSGDTRLTYAQLDERSTRLANHLRREGIGAGDHVGLYLYNGHEYIEAVLAAFKLRAVPININYRYVEAELRYLCRNADLKALVLQQELQARVDGVCGELPQLRHRLASGAEYEAALADASPARDFPRRSGDDLYIIYTGGRTGRPRGVMWRHEDVFFAGLQGGNPGGEPLTSPAELAPLAERGDKALTFLPAAPFIHGAAQWAALIALNAGGKAVIAPGPRFDAARVWQLVVKEQVNTLTLVGDAMARPLADAFAAAPVDASSLIVIASAGAILSRSVQEQLQQLLPNVMLLNNFGASETGHQGNAGDGVGARPRFYFDDTTQVLDEALRPLAAGSGIIGKIARRGRIPLGYYNDPEKTAATFFTRDGERWVMPGDLATVEEDGSITVLGRGAVCINSGGEKIFPEEVEEALKGHPDVLDAVVVGVPDARWGEHVAALVQARGAARPSLAELDAHCRTRIAGYKIPRELHLVDEMVRHPSGKPDYRWAKSEAIRRAAPPTSDAGTHGVATNDAAATNGAATNEAAGTNGAASNEAAATNGAAANEAAARVASLASTDANEVERRVRAWEPSRVSPAGAWGATRRLADVLRRLVERCATLDAGDDARADAIAASAAALEAELTRLNALPACAARDAFADGTYQARYPMFVDRIPLVGLANPISPPVALAAEGEDAVGTLTFTEQFGGAPGFVHGGFVAAVFDQVFGYLGVIRRLPALTATLTVHYRKPTPLGVPLRFEASLERSDGRKSFVRGRCRAGDTIFAEAEGLFIVMAGDRFDRIVQAQG